MVSFSFLNAMDPTTIIFIVLLVVLIAALLIVPMFTNKKRAKQTEELHRSLQPGDVVKTVGGIIGTIKEIREVSPVDKEMVIETGVGDNKTTMIFDLAALYMVMSRVTPPLSEEPVFDNAEKEDKEETAAGEKAPVADSAEPVKEENNAVAEKEEQAASETVATVETEKATTETEQPTADETQPQAETSEAVPVAKKPAAKKPVNTAKKSNGAKSTKK